MNPYIFVVGALILMEFYLIYLAIREWYVDKALAAHGTLIEARISDMYRKRSRDRSPDAYFLKFRFQNDDTTHEVQQRISRWNFSRLYPGAFVSISYLAEHPRIAKLAGQDRDNSQRNLRTGNAVSIGIAIVVLLIILLQR